MQGFNRNTIRECLLLPRKIVGKLKRIDLDEEQATVKYRAEKHGNPRAFKVSSKLISMLNSLSKTSEYIFANGNLSGHRWRFDRQKRRLAE
jgi:hypothetical protein